MAITNVLIDFNRGLISLHVLGETKSFQASVSIEKPTLHISRLVFLYLHFILWSRMWFCRHSNLIEMWIVDYLMKRLVRPKPQAKCRGD